MKALIIVPTYGRIPFLNRMLASFLSQNYEDKELVIVNDDKNVTLCCEYPKVTCINLNKKILVGQKRNIATNLGFYDIMIPYDDDDIMLPNRITNCVKKHIENPEIDCFHNQSSYILYGNEFLISDSGPSTLSYTKKGWFACKGYNHPLNKGEDQKFINDLPNKLIIKDKELIDYVYNYGGINYHLSGNNDTDIEKIAYHQLKEMNLLGQKYFITPDYEEYNKFLKLEKMFKNNESFFIQHVSLGKINIT